MATKDIHKEIEKSIQTANLTTIQLPDTFDGRVQKLVKVYNGIKPLLAVVSVTPLLSPSWRAALATFTQAVEALINAPELAAAGSDFKAGKDL